MNSKTCKTITLSLFLSFLFLLALNSLAGAYRANSSSQYTYRAGPDDTKDSSRTIVLRQIKTLLLEDLAKDIGWLSEIRAFKLTKDQLVTFTAGIVRIEVTDERWDGRAFLLRARITDDSDRIAKSISVLLRDVERVKELEEARKAGEQLLKDNEKLRKDLLSATGTDRQTKVRAYQTNIAFLNAADWFEIGKSYQTAANHRDAVEAYTKAIHLNSQHAPAYANRGDAYANLGDYHQAIRDYDRAIWLSPRYIRAYNARGIAHTRLDDIREAMDDYAKAIELNQKYPVSYFNRGNTYRNIGNNKQAIGDYTKAIELNPEYTAAYNNRGISYRHLGEIEQATKDYDKAIELDPKHVQAYNNRGLIYEALNDHKKAIENYDKAIELDRKYALAYVNRGNTYRNMGDYEQAIKDYTSAINIDPRYALSYNNRGDVYEKLGDTEKALENYKNAAKLGNKQARKLLKEKGIEW